MLAATVLLAGACLPSLLCFFAPLRVLWACETGIVFLPSRFFLCSAMIAISGCGMSAKYAVDTAAGTAERDAGCCRRGPPDAAISCEWGQAICPQRICIECRTPGTSHSWQLADEITQTRAMLDLSKAIVDKEVGLPLRRLASDLEQLVQRTRRPWWESWVNYAATAILSAIVSAMLVFYVVHG